MISGSANGELIFWNVPERKALFQINAHHQFVRGLSFANNHALSADTIFVSAGDDKKINLWSLNKLKSQHQEFLDGDSGADFAQLRNYQARASYLSKGLLHGLDHSFADDLFVTGGAVVQLWNYERSAPLQTFDWGIDTVTKIKFNPS